MTVTESITVATVDFGKIIGLQDLVSTSESDDIVYAKRRNRDTYARFTKSQVPQPSSIVTLVVRRERNHFTLASAWIGPASPPFPEMSLKPKKVRYIGLGML